MVSTVQNNFGIEAWVKPSSVSAEQVIAYNGRTDTAGWGLFIDGGRQAYAGLFGGVDIPGDDINSATPGVWTHVAMVCDGGATTIYVNGQALSYVSAAIPHVPDAGFAMGCDPQNTNGDRFTGLIDEVRVFTFAPGQFSLSDLWPDSVSTNSPPPDTNYVSVLGSSSLIEGSAAGKDSVALSVTPETANWTASPNASWLHLLIPNESGAGSTNVVFSFDANTGPTRTGTLTVASQTLTVTQADAAYISAPIGMTTLISNGLNSVEGVAVDPSGNVLAASQNNGRVLRWSPVSNSVTTQLVEGGYGLPWGVAADDSGGYFVSYLFAGNLDHYSASGSVNTTYMGLPPFFYAVARDRFGNCYLSEQPDNSGSQWNIIEVTAAGAVSTLMTNVPPTYGIAVDVAGNLYMANSLALTKRNPNTGQTTQIINAYSPPELSSIFGAAVDGSGNVYVLDEPSGTIAEQVAATGQYSIILSAHTSGLGAQGIALDAQRNIYYSDQNRELVGEFVRALIDPITKAEPGIAGSDALSPVLPAAENLQTPFAPTSDSSWLTITGVANGIVTYNFAANPTVTNRVAHITLLGQAIQVRQFGAPPSIINALMLQPGVFQFGITNLTATETNVTVLSTTNLSIPLTNWTVVGVASNASPGVMQFTDLQATNTPRFYTIRSP